MVGLRREANPVFERLDAAANSPLTKVTPAKEKPAAQKLPRKSRHKAERGKKAYAASSRELDPQGLRLYKTPDHSHPSCPKRSSAATEKYAEHWPSNPSRTLNDY